MLETYFDTPERTEEREILLHNSSLMSNKIIYQLIEANINSVLIIDKNRQIVAANSRAIRLLKETDLFNILGKRLGEALDCIHACEMPSGCGTSIFCTECGAAKSIKNSKENYSTSMLECRIISKKNQMNFFAYDLRIQSTPVEINDNVFLFVSIEDIQHEKRKNILEKVFFHDILNTAGAINNLIEIAADSEEIEELKNYFSLLQTSSSQLINEILFQQMLVNAENNQLVINLNKQSVNTILESAFSLYSQTEKAKNKIFTVEYLNEDCIIETDKTILVRSLGNLIKNALEAVTTGQNVKLFAELKNNKVNFNVWNQGVIPDEIQLQIFQRSFSTKAKIGRGIGTYSVKLFIENYLNGVVYFNSTVENQTCFTISLNRT